MIRLRTYVPVCLHNISYHKYMKVNNKNNKNIQTRTLRFLHEKPKMEKTIVRIKFIIYLISVYKDLGHRLVSSLLQTCRLSCTILGKDKKRETFSTEDYFFRERYKHNYLDIIRIIDWTAKREYHLPICG